MIYPNKSPFAKLFRNSLFVVKNAVLVRYSRKSTMDENVMPMIRKFSK